MVDSNVKLLVAVPTMDVVRHGTFYDHMNCVQWPEGTRISYSRGQSPAANRNILIRQFLKGDFTHILFIDDDVLVPLDVVKRLLSHDKDVVTGLYLHRQYPHKPILFDQSNELGHCRYKFLTDDVPEGLIRIANCGLGCVLIKREVFDLIEEPYITIGQLDPENWCDDIEFFNKVRESGVEIYADLNVRCGHMASIAVYPIYQNGKWFTTYQSFGAGCPTIPQPVPVEPVDA